MNSRASRALCVNSRRTLKGHADAFTHPSIPSVNMKKNPHYVVFLITVGFKLSPPPLWTNFRLKKGGGMRAPQAIKKNSHFSTNDLFIFSPKKVRGDLVWGDLSWNARYLVLFFWHIVPKFRKLKDSFDTKNETSHQKTKIGKSPTYGKFEIFDLHPKLDIKFWDP